MAVEVAGEAAAPAGVLPEALDAQPAELAREGLERGVVALSAALGVEMLAPDEARAVVGAWHPTRRRCPPTRGPGARRRSPTRRPQDADAALAAGRVGLCLPSTALATPAAVVRLGPLLARLARWAASCSSIPGPPPPATGSRRDRVHGRADRGLAGLGGGGPAAHPACASSSPPWPASPRCRPSGSRAGSTARSPPPPSPTPGRSTTARPTGRSPPPRCRRWPAPARSSTAPTARGRPARRTRCRTGWRAGTRRRCSPACRAGPSARSRAPPSRAWPRRAPPGRPRRRPAPGDAWPGPAAARPAPGPARARWSN